MLMIAFSKITRILEGGMEMTGKVSFGVVIIFVVVLAGILPSVAFSEMKAPSADKPIRDVITDSLSKGQRICSVVGDMIRTGYNAAETVENAILMGFSACIVIRCAVEAGGNLEEVVSAAVRAGASPDIIAACAIEGGAHPPMLARMIDRLCAPGYGYQEDEPVAPRCIDCDTPRPVSPFRP